MTVDLETAALTKTWPRTIFAMVPSMILGVPCLALSIVFFLNDELYQLALLDPEVNASLEDEYREAASKLGDHEGFDCTTRRTGYEHEADEREPPLSLG